MDENRRMHRQLAPAAALALLVLVSGCGDDADPDPDAATTAPDTTSAPATTSAASEEPSTSRKPKPDGTVITTGASDFGPMLYDENDQAIYIWELEPTAQPECYGDCATAWPPVLTKGEPVAEGDVRPGLLDTTKRRDGSRQVTYNDHPLYFYADEAPGEVKCHNVSTHGGLWWVVQPGGDRAP